MLRHDFDFRERSDFMQHLEQTIRERAYHLWLAAGQPDGDADSYWLSAQREILAASVGGTASETSSEVTKPSKKAKTARPAKAKRAAA
jgi:hypothetical protein